VRNHGFVAIGCSAGGLTALQRLLPGLGADLDATVVIVSHLRGEDSRLADVLARAARLPTHFAQEGERIARGQIVVAPPDAHLMVADGQFRLARGPRENGFRPAIDVLFRSAACHLTSQVIGVVLTGLLNDGTAGLRAIKRCGGVTVVQDPDDADFPEMPNSALAHVQIDHCLPLAELPELLSRLVVAPAGRPPPVPDDIQLECTVAARQISSVPEENKLGKPSSFSCPDCGGVLWEIDDGPLLRYRCHVGHAYTATTLAADQSDKLEQALASALRAHREHAELFRRLEKRAEGLNGSLTAKHYRQRAEEYEAQAKIILDFLERDRAPGAEP
jgi:two-component system chemotaxis response regulator CheB